jgi:hypothetical protein
MRYQHATEEGDRRIADSMNTMLTSAKSSRAMNAPLNSATNASGDTTDSESTQLPADSDESGRRESNPRSQLGKLMFCR